MLIPEGMTMVMSRIWTLFLLVSILCSVFTGGGPALASAALQELGYSANQVAAALKGVDPKATTEEMVRYGLKQMVMKG